MYSVSRGVIGAVLSLCLLRAGDDALTTRKQRELNLQSFETVWATLRDHYWDAKMNGLNWRKIHDRFSRKVTAAKDIHEVRSAIDEMLSLLGSSHLALIPASLYEKTHSSKDEKRDVAGKVSQRGPEGDASAPADDDGSPGIRAFPLGGNIVVDSIEPGSPASAAGVMPGWIIRAIDDISMDWLATAIAHVPTRDQTGLLDEMVRSGSMDPSLAGLKSISWTDMGRLSLA